MDLSAKIILVSFMVAILCVLLGFVSIFVSVALSNILMVIGCSMFLAASIATVVFVIAAIVVD